MNTKFTQDETRTLAALAENVKRYGVIDDNLCVASWEEIPVTPEQVERISSTVVAHWKAIVEIYRID